MMSIQSASRIIPAATGAVRSRVSQIPTETPAGLMNTGGRRQAKEPWVDGSFAGSQAP